MGERSVEHAGATIVYDVREPTSAHGDRVPLLLVGQPMTADGFATLASHFTDRTVVTYDPRGLGRSTRSDGRTDNDPSTQADDLHQVITEVGGPVDLFATSGGAVTALDLVGRHPDDVRTLVAHEPPTLAMLPDAERAFAAEREVQQVYRDRGSGHGLAAFIATTMWPGPFTDDYLGAAAADPAAFGLPTDDDGTRDDPLLSGSSNAITAFRPDVDALRAAPTRIVVAAGIESQGVVTGRAAAAVADAIGVPLVEFPSHHAGFLGGEYGQHGEPVAFAARLRDVLGRE